MSSVATASMISAIVCGISLFCVAVETSLYNYPPRDRWKWLLGLVVATLLFTFVAVLTNGKDCNDFTEYNYRYGEVPISCSAAHPNSEMEKK